MTRVMLTVAVWMSLVPVVSASLTPRKESPLLERVPRALAAKRSATALPAKARAATPAKHTAARGMSTEFVVTKRTEILLNGKPCKYEEIPAGATIERMEVAEDKQTVLKIFFRTRK
jgi:hypothetical protein